MGSLCFVGHGKLNWGFAEGGTGDDGDDDDGGHFGRSIVILVKFWNDRRR